MADENSKNESSWGGVQPGAGRPIGKQDASTMERAATITQSDPTFGQIVLNVNLIAGLSRMSRQLLTDAGINEGIAELVIRKFANQLGRAEDTAPMTGSGSGQPKGLRAATISQSVAQAAASLASTDVVNVIHTLPEQYRTTRPSSCTTAS